LFGSSVHFDGSEYATALSAMLLQTKVAGRNGVVTAMVRVTVRTTVVGFDADCGVVSPPQPQSAANEVNRTQRERTLEHCAGERADPRALTPSNQ
jgi:hypothetical protein